MNHSSAYGLWILVAINSAVFVLFAYSFFRPRSRRDWRSLGAFSAFVVAFFVEMYGFPLTIYLLSGWLGSRFPDLGLLTHDAGHVWPMLFGWEGSPHVFPLHILSDVLIVAGFFLLATSWRVLFAAQREHQLAMTGPYAYVRHPQYVAFIIIMIGFLLQWPTLITLVMFPVLVVMYVRLARREEREVRAEFGSIWDAYAARTPGFLPRFGRRRSAHHKAVMP